MHAKLEECDKNELKYRWSNIEVAANKAWDARLRSQAGFNVGYHHRDMWEFPKIRAPNIAPKK